MNVNGFKLLFAQAKQVQNANQANENIREHVGETMAVVGMQITEGIEIKAAGLELDKVTYNLADGKALDGFHMAAVESARNLIEVLGEGPYPAPLVMEIREVETKRGMKQFAELVGYDESAAAFADLEEELEPQEEELEPQEDGPKEAAE